VFDPVALAPFRIEELNMANKMWFITGTSRGFGREWTIAALDRGDEVAATARDTRALKGLVSKYGDRILPPSRSTCRTVRRASPRSTRRRSISAAWTS
jgi:NAD(P)-dependent dehydrogenase (short-subunit alcohol dehydrogenase family)